MTRRVLLDRDLSQAFLDAALAISARSETLEHARSALRDHLEREALGQEARSKTITALTRTWLAPDPSVRHLIGWALARSVHEVDSRPLHTGALLATQPFFVDQAAIVGRILAVQDDVDTRTVRTRMKALWGPSDAVDRSVQATIKTMRSLGMLQGLPTQSVSRRAPRFPADPSLAGWLAACLVAGRGADSISLSEFQSAPELAYFLLPQQLEFTEVRLERHSEGAGRVVLAVDGR